MLLHALFGRRACARLRRLRPHGGARATGGDGRPGVGWSLGVRIICNDEYVIDGNDVMIWYDMQWWTRVYLWHARPTARAAARGASSCDNIMRIYYNVLRIYCNVLYCAIQCNALQYVRILTRARAPPRAAAVTIWWYNMQWWTRMYRWRAHPAPRAAARGP